MIKPDACDQASFVPSQDRCAADILAEGLSFPFEASADTLGSLPVSVMTTPPYEWPTRTVDRSSRARARFTVATSSFSDVSGSCTAVTRRPRVSKSGITLDHEEPSAQAPWTRMTLDAFAIPDPSSLSRKSNHGTCTHPKST